MKKLLSILLSLIICFGYLSVTVSALQDKTDYKSVEVFAGELSSLINMQTSDTQESEIITEATLGDCTNRIIVKSEVLLDSLDSVGY